ncbi:hypothetical protein PIB30_075093 [Stylosanthes scabra]|uniref:Uncharacterized protein n=1 Tax=Stylosanthes scabra TaxID=79078 RepID=A0ABU6RQ64_9FABA|nr:hypothetical protein [Stylosanthes scabra]
MDCKYFTWVDEIDGGWEGLSRVLIGRISEKPNGRISTEDMDAAQLGATREIDLQIMKKMRKIHGEIKTARISLDIGSELSATKLRFSGPASGPPAKFLAPLLGKQKYRIRTLACCCSILKLNEVCAEQGKPDAELNLWGWHQITILLTVLILILTLILKLLLLIQVPSRWVKDLLSSKSVGASTAFDNQPNRFPKLNANFELKSGLTNLLHKFYGRPGKDLIKHIKDFEVICATTRRIGGDKDVVKAFTLSFYLDDRAKDCTTLCLPK